MNIIGHAGTVVYSALTSVHQAVKLYKDFVEKNYAEPIDGKFKDATGEILKALAEEEESDADGNEDFDIEEMEEV